MPQKGHYGFRLAWAGAMGIAAFLLAAAPGRAASSYWTPIGPYGGRVLCIAVDPANPAVRYAGTNAGIFKSTDAGTTWSHLTPAYRDLSVSELVSAPGGALWAVANQPAEDLMGLLRSTGATHLRHGFLRGAGQAKPTVCRLERPANRNGPCKTAVATLPSLPVSGRKCQQGGRLYGPELARFCSSRHQEKDALCDQATPVAA
ncbi:MAG: hypothetical protein HYV63_18065 [Candidatus Schekmanbacteria bacterium]|nr:hypothetical protein [Candidatus Schekmanbacteria bacterium]